MKQIFSLLILVNSIYLHAQQQITLEDIYTKNVFKSEYVAGFRSMKDGNYYTEINDEKLLQKIGFADGEVQATIADLNSLVYNNKKIVVDDYIFNDKETKLLLLEGAENIYRRSVLYYVYVYDIATKSIQKISEQKLLHANFSPQSDKVAYVKNNNLYVYTIATKKELAITTDGKKNAISNGNCDWVYEEEFGFSKAYEWSTSGNYIALYRFDETKVPEFNFAKYDGLYPTDVKFKYPKAGEVNSKIQIKLYALQTNKISIVPMPADTDYYVPRIKWNEFDEQLLVYKLNKLQNKLEIFGYTPTSKKTEIIYTETNEKYIEIKDEILFCKQKNQFFYTSEKSGFTHIWQYDITTKKDVQITTGNWEVVNLLNIDEAAQKIYFTSTEKSPLQRQLFSIKFDGTTKQLITTEEGTHNISSSNQCKYFMDAYSKLNVPTTYTIRNQQGQLLRILKDNAKLRTTMQNYALTQQEIIQIPNETGLQLNAWILKPATVNNGEKHPVLMFQYSGPGSQQVSNSFIGRDYWWYQMLAQQGYIIVCVDGRGTGFRGQEFKKCTYKQLGNLESDDQIAAAKYLATLPDVNKDRIGIWGWSYGGYMSSICILKGADVFKSAIAVAPVTNWRYYDNIYTERFMQLPQTNAKGYDDNSPVNMVKLLKGNYLLIHGSADDNVHYQNTMEMINALIKADKDFDSEVYPNKAHGISGGNTRYHLYKRLTKFVLEKL